MDIFNIMLLRIFYAFMQNAVILFILFPVINRDLSIIKTMIICDVNFYYHCDIFLVVPCCLIPQIF